MSFLLASAGSSNVIAGISLTNMLTVHAETLTKARQQMALTDLKPTPSPSRWDTGSSETTPPPERSEQPNLLIVDDEEGPRQSLRIVFKRDYNVFVASSGLEALAIARENRI